MKKAELAEAIRATRVAWWSRGFVALLSCVMSAYQGLSRAKTTTQRLGLSGRSKAAALAGALRAAPVTSWGRTFVVALLSLVSSAYRGLRSLLAAGPTLTRSYQSLVSLRAALAFAFLRRPKPVRVAVLSVATVAAGALGLMAAYAVSPQETSTPRVPVTNGSTLRIATVTGSGGTTTVAITKTKQGKTRLVPVRILDTVTGPGETETVSVAVLGPPSTVTDEQLLTQIQTLTNEVTNTQLLTETQVVTEIQPVTVVVTDVVTENIGDTQVETVIETDTIVETDTVVVTDTVIVTETVEPPPP